MVIDEKYCKIADSIIEILAREECTIDVAMGILTYVAAEVRNNATVHVKKN